MSTKIGTSIDWPAAERLKTQKAACVAVPVHCFAAAESETPAPLTANVLVPARA